MAHLNANAREWRPSGELASFRLFPSTSAQEGSQPKNTIDSPAVAPSTEDDTSSPSHVLAEVEVPPPYYPTFAQNSFAEAEEPRGVNWTEEFERVMALTKELIDKQLAERNSGPEAEVPATPMQTMNPSGEERQPQKDTDDLDAHKFPFLPGATDAATAPRTTASASASASASAAAATKWTSAVAPAKSKKTDGPVNAHKAPAAAAASSVLPSSAPQEFDEYGRPLPPLTANGNRRWKKPTKAHQKRELAQKNAFEAFANALLYSVSPFMIPLREKCKTSLPHIKVDQRFGKVGQPQSAVAQFVVAPLVTNYRPRHFHDLTPGDLMEFHYDFAQVLKQLKSSNEIHIGYGPVWKRYAVPYCYVNCKEYRQEVLNLCPGEVPNMRVEPIYEDDLVKDITEVVLSVEQLEALKNISIIQAMSRRVDLSPLFDIFDAVFQPIENYRIIIRDLHCAPSKFLVHTSQHEIDQKPSPLVLYNDPKLWYELPSVSLTRPSQNGPTGVDASHPSTTEGKGTANGKPGMGDHSAKDSGRRRHDKNALHSIISLSVAGPVVVSLLCVAFTTLFVIRKRSR